MNNLLSTLIVTVFLFLPLSGQETGKILFTKENFLSQIKRINCSIHNEKLTIYGNPRSKMNGWRAVTVPLKLKTTKNVTIGVKGEVFTKILPNSNGYFLVWLREIDKNNKTIKYTGQKYKESTKLLPCYFEVRLDSKTVTTELLFIGVNLTSSSYGQVTNFSYFTVNKSNQSTPKVNHTVRKELKKRKKSPLKKVL